MSPPTPPTHSVKCWQYRIKSQTWWRYPNRFFVTAKTPLGRRPSGPFAPLPSWSTSCVPKPSVPTRLKVNVTVFVGTWELWALLRTNFQLANRSLCRPKFRSPQPSSHGLIHSDRESRRRDRLCGLNARVSCSTMQLTRVSSHGTRTGLLLKVKNLQSRCINKPQVCLSYSAINYFPNASQRATVWAPISRMAQCRCVRR